MPDLNKKGEYVYGIYSPFLLYRKREVDPQTIGQYTGIQDKNGVKIFEGDIIKKETAFIGAVYWDDKRASFYWGYEWSIGQNINSLSVIGNIHDNPELLEVKA